MGRFDRFCQSCGMPMDQDPGKGGTNADGTVAYEHSGILSICISDIGKLLEESTKKQGIRVPLNLFAMDQAILKEKGIIICELCQYFPKSLENQQNYFKNCNKCACEDQFKLAKAKFQVSVFVGRFDGIVQTVKVFRNPKDAEKEWEDWIKPTIEDATWEEFMKEDSELQNEVAGSHLEGSTIYETTLRTTIKKEGD